ncbi:MAG: hypothetical protein J0I20_19415 [Chloroflexi bacterium]|nr:hypothetical protein [Chloroflexota bacterium]OJW06240.1 MAG: hypothetical protein BGO39_25695 [Chloroflexi bacterium 54-19]
MSQQPPDWFRQPRGPRIGCADVTIVSIASIAAFVLLIFVVLRPDFARFIDLTGGNDITVGAVRATDTPVPFVSTTPTLSGNETTSAAGTTGAAGTSAPGTTALATTVAAAPATPTVPAPTTAAPTPTPPATLSFKSVTLTDACRLRQTPDYHAPIIQIFPKGTAFKAYDQQESVKDSDTGVTSVWQRVEPADNTNRQGWMVVECLGT